MSHTASTVDTLLIRPTHGDQTGAGNNERTHHSKGIQKKPAPKRVTPAATDTKPADPTNRIGGPKPHSSLRSPEPRSADRQLRAGTDAPFDSKRGRFHAVKIPVDVDGEQPRDLRLALSSPHDLVRTSVDDVNHDLRRKHRPMTHVQRKEAHDDGLEQRVGRSGAAASTTSNA